MTEELKNNWEGRDKEAIVKIDNLQSQLAEIKSDIENGNIVPETALPATQELLEKLQDLLNDFRS